MGETYRRAHEAAGDERAVAVLRDDEAGHCQRISGEFITVCLLMENFTKVIRLRNEEKD